MKNVFTPSLALLFLLFVGCGKNDNNNTTTPVPVPVNNPVNTPIGTPNNINALRSLFSTSPLNLDVNVGDFFDKVETSGLFNINFNIFLFGQRFGAGNTPERALVSSVSNNMIDVTIDDSSTAEVIDRTSLLNAIFSDDRNDIFAQSYRGCIQINNGNNQAISLEAAIIDKYLEIPGIGFNSQYTLVERVVVSTAVPLYLNPISVQSSINPTRYVKRFKRGVEDIRILGAGPCQ